MTRRLALATLLLPFCPLGLQAACPMHPDAPPELSKNHECCRIAQEKWEAAVEAMQPSKHSLYQLSSTWKNQDGQELALSGLAGRPQLVAMAYTHCQYACPRILADLKAIEAQLPDATRVGFTIVSIDPSRDTPERLREYASEQGLDLSRWTLLHGDNGDVLELANLLGVRYAKTSTGDFSHSNIITLLTPGGEIALQQDGLGADNAPTLAKIKDLLPEPGE